MNWQLKSSFEVKSVFNVTEITYVTAKMLDSEEICLVKEIVEYQTEVLRVERQGAIAGTESRE